MYQSIATIDSPEFINLQPLDLNPLMSSCEIKVLYVGENRNRSFITKEVATQMAATLRGAPIVGYYRDDKEDFRDHGDRLVVDGDGIKFESLTKPYGFVAPDAKVWFQKFEEETPFHEKIIREYLMTTGYLWTGQYPECKSAATDEGKPQSMELDEDTLQGDWEFNSKGMDFFIINDAIFSKLCILGDDVPPCFEGASVTAPNVSKHYTLDKSFTTTLYNMMQDLQKFALNGGQTMPQEMKEVIGTATEQPVETEFTQTQDGNSEPVAQENQGSVEAPKTSFKKKEEEEEKKDSEGASGSATEEKEDSTESGNPSSEKKDEEDKKKKFELEHQALQEKYEQLLADHTTLQSQFTELKAFKDQYDREQKTQLIETFYMLSADDKKDVTENINKYSLDEIKAKLCILCYEKRVSFEDAETKTDAQEAPTAPVTYTLGNSEEDSVPAYIQALRNTRKQREEN